MSDEETLREYECIARQSRTNGKSMITLEELAATNEEKNEG